MIENNVASRSKTEHGIYVSNSGDRPVIRNNTVWGNSDSGIQLNGDVNMGGDGIISGALVERNKIHNNGYGGGAAINLDGVQGSRFQNNLLYDNHASGISLHRIDGAQGSKNNLVINNTILQAGDARWVMNIQNSSTGNVLRNNILLTNHPSRGSINISADSRGGFVSDYNLLTPRFTLNDSNVITLASWRSTTGQDSHSLVATPTQVFTNVSGKDFTLKSGSLAVDKGSSISAPSTDIAGRARPAGAGWDIGAHETGTAVVKPAPTMPTTPRKFDFGAAGSHLVAGYTRVTTSTDYSKTTGYGWIGDDDLTAKTRAGNTLASDFIYGDQVTFAVDLPNGTYSVKITLGKTSYGYDQNAVYLEGTHLGTVSASADQVKTLTYTVTISDGQLSLKLKDLGGKTPSVLLAGLEITPTTGTPSVPVGTKVPSTGTPDPAPAVTSYKYDFGGKSTTLATGYTRVTANTSYQSQSGHGFVGSTKGLLEKSRGSGDALASDFVYGNDSTFAVKVPNGKYKVVLTLGKTSFGYDQNAIHLEGKRVATVSAVPNQVKVLTYEVTVKDGQFTLWLKDLGGKTPSFLLGALQLVPISTTPKTTAAATNQPAKGIAWELASTTNPAWEVAVDEMLAI